jgi:septal ring factor EnvC (AmiA/AmiB activator)
MMRRGMRGVYRGAGANPAGDTDALQTDVMRFLSVLALCLMAVFALVQSLPLQDTRTAARNSDALQSLQAQISVQQRRAADLQAQLQQLARQLHTTRASAARAEQELASAEQTLHAVTTRTRQTRTEHQRLSAELSVLERRVSASRTQLARLEQRARRGTDSPGTVQRQLDEQRRTLDEVEQRVTATAGSPSPAADAEPPPPPTGFTLRFASADALQRLVRAGRVELYAMADKHAWRLHDDNGSANLRPSAFPRWFHEMEAATVPPGYRAALAGSGSAIAEASPMWGVQLPTGTRQAIERLSRGTSGGTLVIGADGGVSLERE